MAVAGAWHASPREGRKKMSRFGAVKPQQPRPPESPSGSVLPRTTYSGHCASSGATSRQSASTLQTMSCQTAFMSIAKKSPYPCASVSRLPAQAFPPSLVERNSVALGGGLRRARRAGDPVFVVEARHAGIEETAAVRCLRRVVAEFGGDGLEGPLQSTVVPIVG